MLALTDVAVQAVRGIVAESPELPDNTAGVRITGETLEDGGTRLELYAAEAPASGDTVVEDSGARVFVEPELETYVEDKMLDASVEAERIRFTLVAQD